MRRIDPARRVRTNQPVLHPNPPTSLKSPLPPVSLASPPVSVRPSMRIRRRPQAQQQALPEQQPSDPSSAAHPPPPPNAWLPLSGDEQVEQGKRRRNESEEELHSHRPDADPSPAARRPALLPSQPQGRSIDYDPPVHGHGHGGGAQRQGAAADGHTHTHTHTHESLENGHRRDESERPAMQGVPVNVKEGIKVGGGAKKRRRGPAVLMEGSRCSRVNGRGWRCSQPTLVGYSLCEHHLGKGRQQQRANGRTEPSSWRNGAATLGRTEPGILKKAALLPEVATAQL